MDEIIANIKKYLKIINKNTDAIDKENEGLLDFVIGEVLDRVQLYLNSETIPTKLERILANIVNTGLKKCLKEIEISSEDNTAVDQVVTSISDNGQSISYANEVTQYFTTVSDKELFTGFTGLLSRYRRVKVVYPKINDETNS
jgi:signal transduction histidine kinase|nr:MAG TPA: tail connector protein [Caudoviricetes sp.]